MKTYLNSTGTLNVLERSEAEDCKSSEATWLPVAWSSPHARRAMLQPEAGAREASLPPKADAVAAAAGSAACPLAEVFDEAARDDLHDYPLWVRVEKAKTLMLNPHYDIMEIASELGFKSLAQFSQVFKRCIGESPHAYRARLPIKMCNVEG